MCSMEEVVPFIHDMEFLLLQKQGQDKQGIKGRWMELDIKDMFPSIDKLALLEAIKFIHQKFVHHKNKRVHSELIFSIHKKYRSLDELRRSLHPDYFQFSWSEVLIFVLWDLQCNNMFYCQNKLFFQLKGVPIGGTMSAQLASLYCMACEYVQYYKGFHTMSFYKIVRFRDNIILFLLQDTSYQEIILFLSKIYNLQFTKESAGSSLLCLEFLVTNVYKGQMLTHVSLQWKGAQPLSVPRPEMHCERWVSPHSQNAKYICKVYLPSALKKCRTYAKSQEDFVSNVQGLKAQLLQAGYPRSWWTMVWAALHPRTGVG